MSEQPCPPPPAFDLLLEQPEWSERIEQLLDAAFGPGRFVKSSERVREIAEFAPELSFCAFEGERLLGVVRMWRVRVGGEPAVFLGPLAVDAEQRKGGVGGLLVEQACRAARLAGEPAVLLVGDEPYFARFGFAQAPDAELPGPVDRKRVLARRFADVSLQGPVRGR